MTIRGGTVMLPNVPPVIFKTGFFPPPKHDAGRRTATPNLLRRGVLALFFNPI